MRKSERCQRSVSWTVTRNWIGHTSHESHRCELPRGHGRVHRVRAKNYPWWRRPPWRDQSGPGGAKDGYLTWEQ